MHVQVIQTLTLQCGGSWCSSGLPKRKREQAPTACAQDDSAQKPIQKSSAAAVKVKARRVRPCHAMAAAPDV